MNAIAQERARAFGLDESVIADILENASPTGQRADAARLNLGFGFLYYALARSLRPEHVVVIGSRSGFTVACLALGLKDNGGGRVSFVDPSSSARLSRFGLDGIVTHHRVSSAEFFSHYDEPELPGIDLACIDAGHSFTQVRQDFIDVMRNTRRNAYILLHDTNLLVHEALRNTGARRWLAIVRRDTDWFEVVDFPFSSGLALIRVLRDGPWHPGL